MPHRADGVNPAGNRLIARLPARDRRRLLAACEPVPLVLARVLCEPGGVQRHAWFPIDGFVSLVAEVDHHPALEVGMVGREGMLGAHIALGSKTVPLRALVQGEGTAWRIDATALRRELVQSPPLRACLLTYLVVVMAQLTSSGGCLRFHTIGPRLARWLLMSHDRAATADFRVTHEFLASMLGVRRAGVTLAAGALQRQGLIRYHRGVVSILDRPRLESAACSCYLSDGRAFALGMR